MKIKELFEEEETLLGKKIRGKKEKMITINTPNEEWNSQFECDFKGISSLKYCPTRINGNFICSDNRLLKSLIGAPQEGVTDFKANNCDLRSLEGCPTKIDGNFECWYNLELTSLKGMPQEGVKSFHIRDCSLTSLEGAPQKINGDFNCAGNYTLTSLKGMPQEGVNNVYINKCELESLEGIAPHIKGSITLDANKRITSLKHIYRHLKSCREMRIGAEVESNILGVLKIKNLEKLSIVDERHFEAKEDISNIINKYLPNPTSDQIIDCQNELIEAGFEEYAEL